ncbi:MAG: hypothetical protein Q9163_004346 [Psora crenata]
MAASTLLQSEGSLPPPSSPAAKGRSNNRTLTFPFLEMPPSTDLDLTIFPATDANAPSFFDEPLDFSHTNSFEAVNNDPASAQTLTTPLTVSPQDIMTDVLSAPPSTTLTNLTTPGTSIYESPWIATSSETSPLFGEDELGEGAKEWPSLFEPMDDVPQAVAMTPSISNASSCSRLSHVNNSPSTTQAPTAPDMSRNQSSPGQSASKSGRHSFTSGVGSRKRDKPLPAITVDDPSDTVAIKRARNTMAARKSRQRRMERTEQLENEVAALEQEVERWRTIALSNGYVEGDSESKGFRYGGGSLR